MDAPIDEFRSLAHCGAEDDRSERPTADRPTKRLVQAIQLSNHYAPLAAATNGTCSNESDRRAECELFDRGNPASEGAAGGRSRRLNETEQAKSDTNGAGSGAVSASAISSCGGCLIT